jgi:hypothetical protein
MIEGTRAYKGQKIPAASSTKPDLESIPSPTGDAANPERRELFQQIVPSLGKGLVKILRESNLLKEEIQRALKR